MVKCCDMSAGMLKEPVTFERQGEVSDGAGGYTKSWAAVSGAPTRGHLKAMSGRERWASERTEAVSSYRLVVRYFSDLTEKDSVVIRSRRYNITFIDNLEFEDKWLRIDLGLGVAV